MNRLIFNSIFDSDWSATELQKFIEENKDGIELVLQYSYIGSTQSNLDVMRDYLTMSFCIEKILEHSELIELKRKYDFRSGISLFIRPINIESLSNLLEELSILDTQEKDPDDFDLLNINEEINEYEEKLNGIKLKVPEEVDSYWANWINAGI